MMIDLVALKEDLNFYSDKEILEKYNLSIYMFDKILKENNLIKVKSNVRNLNLAKRQISKDDLYQYYILENHTFEETQNHFNIKSMLPKLLKEYGIKKDSENHIKNIKKAKLEKYGDENYNNSNKRAITNNIKYGVDNQFKRAELIDENIEKKKQRYGTANNQAKNWETRIKNYGTIEASYIAQQATYKQTCLDKYGETNAAKTLAVKQKIKNTVTDTFQEKYGCSSYWETDNAKRSNGSINSRPNIEFKKLLDDNNIKYDIEFKLEGKYYDFKVNSFLIEVDPSPTHNINWTPWSENGIDKNYHINKSNIAEKNNYRCIHIWDWDSTYKIISLLKPKIRIYARKCQIKSISISEANKFLTQYHLQGYAKDSIRYGLYHDDLLVQVMTFGTPRYSKKWDYELIRLCTHPDYLIVGGTEKLFKQFIREYNPSSIISYCDRSKFKGNVYNRLGFVAYGNYNPSIHWYNLKTKKHITDNLLRQRGFDQLFGKEYGCYGKGTNNLDLMLEHDFVQIADCGQQRFIWTNTYKATV